MTTLFRSSFAKSRFEDVNFANLLRSSDQIEVRDINYNRELL